MKRLLKCHVRREKGLTRGPGGPSVTGQGAHVSTAGKRSGAKTKKIKVPVEPPEAVSIPQVTYVLMTTAPEAVLGVKMAKM
jgi:hypothetical protein